MSAADLATLSRACGEMSFVPPAEWMVGFFKAAGEVRLSGEFGAHELVDMAWGLSRMGGVRAGAAWAGCFFKVCECAIT